MLWDGKQNKWDGAKPSWSCHAFLIVSRADNSSWLARDYHQIIVKFRAVLTSESDQSDEDIKQKHTVIDLRLVMPPPFLSVCVVTEITNIKLEGVYRPFNLSIWGKKAFFSPSLQKLLCSERQMPCSTSRPCLHLDDRGAIAFQPVCVCRQTPGPAPGLSLTLCMKEDLTVLTCTEFSF